jgi:hypothetical protein
MHESSPQSPSQIIREFPAEQVRVSRHVECEAKEQRGLLFQRSGHGSGWIR